MIQPKRIHQYNTASGGELASSPLWIEVEVPDGSGGFYNRKTPLPSGGTPSDVIQNVTATTATTNVDLDTGNLVFVDVQANTEITLSNIVAGKKYRFVFSTLAPTKTVTFSTTYFNGSTGTTVPDVVVSGLRTSYFYWIVDFFGTGGTSFVSEVGRNLYALTEADVIGTTREYTQGQGFDVELLTITAGTPNVVNWSVDGSNMKRLVLNADAELQVPTGSINAVGRIEVENDGGFTLTFAAGLSADFIVGDTPTTTDTEHCLINYDRTSSRTWLVVTNQNP